MRTVNEAFRVLCADPPRLRCVGMTFGASIRRFATLAVSEGDALKCCKSGDSGPFPIEEQHGENSWSRKLIWSSDAHWWFSAGIPELGNHTLRAYTSKQWSALSTSFATVV
jgi:hypothetical protein